MTILYRVDLAPLRKMGPLERADELRKAIEPARIEVQRHIIKKVNAGRLDVLDRKKTESESKVRQAQRKADNKTADVSEAQKKIDAYNAAQAAKAAKQSNSVKADMPEPPATPPSGTL